MCQKVTLGDPGAPELSNRFSNSCREVALGPKIQPRIGEFWWNGPCLVQVRPAVDQARPKLAVCGPSSVEPGRLVPKLINTWPALAMFLRTWSSVGQSSPTLATGWPKAARTRGFWADPRLLQGRCWTALQQLWSSLGSLGETSQSLGRAFILQLVCLSYGVFHGEPLHGSRHQTLASGQQSSTSWHGERGGRYLLRVGTRR